MTDRFPELLYDSRCLDHENGPGHPERPRRLERIRRVVEDEFPEATWRSASPADRSHIERIHDTDYVDTVLGMRGSRGRLDADTAVSPGSVDAAELAAGMAIDAVRIAVENQRDAFAFVRPPGHHAEADRGMGFCLFNNVAIATRWALDNTDVERVLVVDWDVHHGNGTERAFYDTDEVLFFSTHQAPFYPGTGDVDDIGRGDGEGLTINVPLPAGTGDKGLYEAFDSILIPAARSYAPDLVVLSAGFDAHGLDPVGGMQATTDGFARLATLLHDLASHTCEGRLAAVLEGGYHLDALANGCAACVGVFAGIDAASSPADDHAPSRAVEQALVRARSIQTNHWPRVSDSA